MLIFSATLEKQWSKHQREDQVLGIWIRAVLNKKPPKKEVIARSPQHQTMSRNFESFTVIRGEGCCTEKLLEMVKRVNMVIWVTRPENEQ